MNLYRGEEDIIQNLKDAGCDEDTIQSFMNNLQYGKLIKGTQLLQKHRRSLLNNLHKDQKQIDCLDYLLYMFKKEQEGRDSDEVKF